MVSPVIWAHRPNCYLSCPSLLFLAYKQRIISNSTFVLSSQKVYKFAKLKSEVVRTTEKNGGYCQSFYPFRLKQGIEVDMDPSSEKPRKY